MRHESIPYKTAAGVQELQTRAQHLQGNLRTLLIQIDGYKTIPELESLLGNTTRDHLIDLYAYGMIAWREVPQEVAQHFAQYNEPIPQMIS